MPLKPCAEPGCPNLSDQPRCALHRRDPNRSWSTNRDHAAHKRFARAVKARAQGRCEVCGSTDGCQAHHRNGNVRDNRLENGLFVCTEHHRELDSHAR